MKYVSTYFCYICNVIDLTSVLYGTCFQCFDDIGYISYVPIFDNIDCGAFHTLLCENSEIISKEVAQVIFKL